jgi:transaldolase
MLLYLDTADISSIEEFAPLIDGVTTTPTIIKRDGQGLTSEEFVAKVRTEYPNLDIHLEALAESAQDTEELINTFKRKHWYDASKVAFKVPVTREGLKATKRIKRSDPSVRINLHMVFSPAQATLAMLSQPAYIAPLVGRYADRATVADAGLTMLSEVIACKRSLASETVVLASSIRSVHDFEAATLLGADAVTLPPAVLKEALQHPLTTEGVEQFWKDLD